MSARAPRAALLTALSALASRAAADPRPAAPTQQCIAEFTSAQDLVDQKKLSAARDRFIACAEPACPEQIQAECARQLDAVRKRVPSIVVEVKSPSGDAVLDARVFIDGHQRSMETDGGSIDVDPGRHVLRVERDGAAAERDFVAEEGRQRERVSVRLLATVAPSASDQPGSRQGVGANSCPFLVGPRLGGLGPSSYVNAAIAMQFAGACWFELSLGVGYQFYGDAIGAGIHAIPVLVRGRFWAGDRHAFIADLGLGVTGYQIDGAALSGGSAAFTTHTGVGYGFRFRKDGGWRFGLLGGAVYEVDADALDLGVTLLPDPAFRSLRSELGPYGEASVAYMF